MKFVSIIVPVYNSEKYINRCIDSILNQSYKNIEVIIIDDGSTDSSFEICKNYADLNKNIKLVSKKNEGVSKARNTGINIATGEWIMFLDSDDWIESNTLMDAISLASDKNYDTICWNYKKFIDNEFVKCNKIDEVILNDRENIVYILYSIIESSYYYTNYFGEYIRAPWAKMLSRSIIKDNNIRFDEKLRIGEDAMFLIEYFTKAKNIKFINEFNNTYRITSTSVVGRYKPDLDEQIIIQLDKINYLMKNVKEANENILKTVITKFYLNSIYELIYNYDFKNNNENNEFDLIEFMKNNKVDMKSVQLKLLSKKQILMYIFIKYNKIKLLELTLKLIVKLI